MRWYKLAVSSLAFAFMVKLASGQAVVPCDTSGLYQFNMQQAAVNQQKACAIVVTNTSTQQMQCYYQQLATYYQQLAKSIQQDSKDKQQISKDQQQLAKDAQQIAFDKVLADRLMALNNDYTNYDECDAFIQVLIPLLGERCKDVTDELKKIHTNRSGQADGTNPGGQTHNINGFDNPGYLNKKK